MSLGFGALNLLISLLLFIDLFVSRGGGWLLPLLMGYIGVHFVRLAFDARPRFQVDEGGIIDRTFMGGGELRIPWEMVREVRVTGLGGALHVDVLEDAKLWRGAGWPRNLVLRLESLLGKRSVQVMAGSHLPNRSQVKDLLEAKLLAHERKQLGFEP
jgi:hypothetical protein